MKVAATGNLPTVVPLKLIHRRFSTSDVQHLAAVAPAEGIHDFERIH